MKKRKGKKEKKEGKPYDLSNKCRKSTQQHSWFKQKLKTLRVLKLRIEGNFLKLIKDIYPKHKANIIYINVKSKTIILNISLTLNILLENLTNTTGQEKKSLIIAKGDTSWRYFYKDIILHIEHLIYK